MKPKTMTKGDLKLEIVEHIILKNYWEYYILKDDEYATEDIKTAVVMGDAIELGDVSLSIAVPKLNPSLLKFPIPLFKTASQTTSFRRRHATSNHRGT